MRTYRQILIQQLFATKIKEKKCDWLEHKRTQIQTTSAFSIYKFLGTHIRAFLLEFGQNKRRSTPIPYRRFRTTTQRIKSIYKIKT